MEKSDDKNIYEKNKYYCNNLNNNSCNNINLKNNLNNKNNSPLKNLFEVENFLCNLKNFKKSVNIYKLFKN